MVFTDSILTATSFLVAVLVPRGGEAGGSGVEEEEEEEEEDMEKRECTREISLLKLFVGGPIRTKIKLHKKVSTLDNTCVNFVGMCDKNKTRHKLNRRKFIQTKLSQSTVKVGEMEV